MRYYIQRHSHKIAKTILFIIVLVACGLATKYFIANKGELGRVDDKQPTTQADSTPVSVSSRILATGNVAWGGHLYELAELNTSKSEYGFSGLGTLSRNEYDAWIGNLNCTPVSKPLYSSMYDCPAEYLSEAKRWFTVVALGTPHTNTEAAQVALQPTGVQYVGDANTVNMSNLCDVISLPARFTLGDGSFKTARLPLALCSYNITSTVPSEAQYREVEKYAGRLPVWVYASMGDGTALVQTELQKSVYRSFVDMGADVVIGNHPYAVQGAESYKGRLIVYSLGNFMYPGTATDSELQKSVSLKVTVSAKLDTNMTSWSSLAGGCTEAHDTCMQQAASRGLTKPAYSYDLGIVSTDSASGLTRKTKSEWEEQAQKRLNWNELLPTLSYTKN